MKRDVKIPWTSFAMALAAMAMSFTLRNKIGAAIQFAFGAGLFMMCVIYTVRRHTNSK